MNFIYYVVEKFSYDSLSESTRSSNAKVIRCCANEFFSDNRREKKRGIILGNERFCLFFDSHFSKRGIIIGRIGLASENMKRGKDKVLNLHLVLAENELALLECRLYLKADTVLGEPLVATRLGYEGNGYATGLLTSLDFLVYQMMRSYPMEIGSKTVAIEVTDGSVARSKSKSHLGWTTSIVENMPGFRRSSYVRGETVWKKEYR